jgi:hypothetical protein
MRRVLGSRLLSAGFLLAGAFAIAPGAEAAVALAPNAAILYPTQSTLVTVIVSGLPVVGGGTGTLSISGLGTYVTAIPATPVYTKTPFVTVATTTFVLQAAPNAVAGARTITVQDLTFGAGSATFSLTILEPQLHLSITTPSITLGMSTVNVFVNVQPDPGFGAYVASGGVPFLFSVDNVPLPPSTPANVTAGGRKSEFAPFNATLTFPFSRTGVVTPGTYTVPVLAIWTGTTRATLFTSANLTLNIPDIAVVPPASPVTVCNGGIPVSTNGYVLTPQYNYSGTPSLSVLSAPAGVTVTPPFPAAMPPGRNVSFGLQAVGAAAGNTTATARLLDAANVVDKNIVVGFTVINPLITGATSPSTLPVQAGGAAQNFSVSATGPTAICSSVPAVDVTLVGLPAGFTYPAVTLNAPAFGPANLPVSASAGVLPGSYPATMRFSAKTLPNFDVPVTVTVTVGPDFTLGATPTTLTLQPSASGTIDFSLLPLNGFSGAANVTIPAIQSVTATPSAFSLQVGMGPQTVTFLASAAALPGTYTATVSGVAAGVPAPRTVNISIVIPSPPDFTVTAAPSSVSMQPGGSGKITYTVAPLNGWNFPVALAVPAILNFTANPATATIPGGNGSVDVVYTASGTAPVGTTSVTVTATNVPGVGPPRSHTAGATLVMLPPPDYTLAVNPVSLRLVAGDSGSVVVSVTPLNGFAGTVHVTAPSIPNVTFVPAVFDVGVGAGQTVQVVTAAGATIGTSTVTFTGTAPGIATHTASFSLTLDPRPDFTLLDAPSALLLSVGGTGQTTVFFQGVNGFSGPVSVTAPVIGGVTFTPASFTLSTGAVQAVAIAVAANAPTGTTVDNFTGTAAGVTGPRLARFATTITTGPDYQLSAVPSVLQILAGGSGGTEISLVPLNGYAKPVSVTAAPPNGVTVTPATFTLAGTAPQAVTIGASAGATGSLDVVFNGVDGAGLAHAVTVRLTVASPPDFQLSVTPTSLRLSSGSSASVVVTATPLNGFAGTVNVASLLPAGLTSDTPAFALSPGESRTVTLAAAANTPAGLVNVTFNGTATGITGTRSASLPVSIDVPPDFTLNVTPTVINLPAGGKAPAQVTLVPLNGWSSSVDVLVTGSTGVSVVPPSFTLLPNTLQPVEIRAADDAPAGAVTLLFRASGAVGGTGLTVTRTVNVQVSVGASDFNVRITPAAPQVTAGRAATLSFILDPVGSFAGTATITPLNLPAGATLAPAQPLLAPNVPQAATLSIPRTTPPGSYTLTFRADETPGSNVRARRPLLISKTLTLPLVVLPPSGGFSVVAVPPTVLASPGQAVAVRYEFRNLGDEPLVITGDTFVRRDRNGVVFDTTEETVGLRLPPRGTASASNTVLATGEQFAKSGSPAIVFEDRTFRATPDSTGFVATATAPVAVTAVNSLLATTSVTRLSVVYPPSGTLVGRGDNLRAQGVIFGSGTGNVLVGWLYDGVLVETATVPLQNGSPTAVSNSVTLPTLLAGNHEIAFAILAPNTLSSPSVQIYVDEGLTTLRLVAPTAGAVFAPAFSAPTFSWIPAPGIARYGVGLRRRGTPGARYRWAFTSDTFWGPPASLWNELPESDYEWVVRGFTASGRSLLDRQMGGATAPPTSEGTLDVADGWTVTSSTGRFSIGGADSALADLAGQSSRVEDGARFAWREIAGALYIHALYLETPEGPRRVRTEILPKAGLLLPVGALPKGGPLLWRVTAIDREGRPLGATPLAAVPGGAR